MAAETCLSQLQSLFDNPNAEFQVFYFTDFFFHNMGFQIGYFVLTIQILKLL